MPASPCPRASHPLTAVALLVIIAAWLAAWATATARYRFWAESGAPMNRRRAPAKDDQQQRSAALRWRLLLCDCERVLVMRADRFRVMVVVACSMPASDGGYIRLSEGDIAASCGSAVAAFVAVVSGRKR